MRIILLRTLPKFHHLDLPVIFHRRNYFLVILGFKIDSSIYDNHINMETVQQQLVIFFNKSIEQLIKNNNIDEFINTNCHLLNEKSYINILEY